MNYIIFTYRENGFWIRFECGKMSIRAFKKELVIFTDRMKLL